MMSSGWKTEDFGNPWLSHIHEVVAPADVDWLPSGPGLLVLAGLVGCAMLSQGVRRWRLWLAEGYRREATQQLSEWILACQNGQFSTADLAAIPALIRRVALMSWGRETVVPLDGKNWLDFLNQSLRPGPCLAEGELLLSIAFLPPSKLQAIEQRRVLALLHSLRRWVHEHVVESEHQA